MIQQTYFSVFQQILKLLHILIRNEVNKDWYTETKVLDLSDVEVKYFAPVSI